MAFALALFGGAFAAHAQGGVLGGDFSVPPTPVPVGSGARAAGMANAFVAVADDATAASWNPAGLVQLERPELSLVGAYTAWRDDFRAAHDPFFDSEHTYNSSELNYASAVLPLPFLVLGRNAVVSLNYQRRYDFERSFDVRLRQRELLPPPLNVLSRAHTRLRFDQDGGLGAISPAFAIEITNTLSAGLSLNLWRSSFLNDNRFEQNTRIDSRGFLGASRIRSRAIGHEEYENIRGENVTVGLLWNPAPRWSLGLRYDSGFTADTDYKSYDREFRLNLSNAVPRPAVNGSASSEKRELRFPSTWSAGAAYRASDRLTLALDLSRTDWDKLEVRAQNGQRFSLVDGIARDDLRNRVDFDATWNARFGAEYIFVPREPRTHLNLLWTLRSGLSYEEEPASQRPTRASLNRGSGSPDRFFGLSLGAGLQVRQRVNFDFGYQLRYGADVNEDVLRGVEGFESDALQHRFLFSTVVYF